MRGKTKLLPARLREVLAGMPGMILAFSGGLDSRFLAHAAQLCGCGVIAAHVAGPHVCHTDSAFGRTWAEHAGLEFHSLEMNPLVFPAVAGNSRLRCRECKQGTFMAIRTAFADRLNDGFRLCDGGNASDILQYRPGAQAAAACGVISPLAQAGPDKPHRRELAHATGLANPQQHARPCLLTRLAYGVAPTRELLLALAAAEEEIGELLTGHCHDAPDFRLRLSPEPVLHLTRSVKTFEEQLISIAERHGFAGCKIEILPELSGYFDRMENPGQP